MDEGHPSGPGALRSKEPPPLPTRRPPPPGSSPPSGEAPPPLPARGKKFLNAELKARDPSNRAAPGKKKSGTLPRRTMRGGVNDGRRHTVYAQNLMKFIPHLDHSTDSELHERDAQSIIFSNDGKSSKLKEGSSSAVYVYRLTADGKLGSWLGTEFEGIVAKFKYIKPKNLVCRYLWTKDSDMLKGSIQTLKIDDQEISRLAALAKTAGVPGLESWSKNEGAGEGQSKHDGGGGGGGGSGGEAFNKLCEPVQITAGAGMEVIKAITRFSTV